jgi:hypothetical protein
MKLIHEGGYSTEEREAFKEIVYSNTVQSMRVILEAMEPMGIRLNEPRNEYHLQTIFYNRPRWKALFCRQRLASPSRVYGPTTVYKRLSIEVVSTN